MIKCNLKLESVDGETIFEGPVRLKKSPSITILEIPWGVENKRMTWMPGKAHWNPITITLGETCPKDQLVLRDWLRPGPCPGTTRGTLDNGKETWVLENVYPTDVAFDKVIDPSNTFFAIKKLAFGYYQCTKYCGHDICTDPAVSVTPEDAK